MRRTRQRVPTCGLISRDRVAGTHTIASGSPGDGRRHRRRPAQLQPLRSRRAVLQHRPRQRPDQGGRRHCYGPVEVTLLDMVQRPDLAGGLDQVATVACGLVEHGLLDPEILASQALTYPETVRRRAGHILDEAVAALDMTGVACDSGPLASTLTARAAVTPLMPGVGRFFPPSHDGAEPLRVDERWRVRVNALLDPDT